MKSRLRVISCLFAVALITGCVRVDVGTHAPTIGEELIELYKAKQMGAMSEAEFEAVRQALMLALAD